MTVEDSRSGEPIIVGQGSPLHAALAALAGEARLVFFAGLPGTGKSLLIHQLAHLAHGRGRGIHLLQWDVARPAFEASVAGRRYPVAAGVTHGVIRLAVGRWVRKAIARWHAGHPGVEDILIGETPFVGNRFIELARVQRDEAEAVLSAVWTRFVIPVPSRALRAHIESERARRASEPLHRREQEDAPPEVLRDLWAQLVTVARTLGVPAPPAAAGTVPYDPAMYQAVFERLLVRRHGRALLVEARLPAEGFSAYDFRVPTADLVPSEAEAERHIHEVEAQYPDPAALQREIDAWYLIP